MNTELTRAERDQIETTLRACVEESLVEQEVLHLTVVRRDGHGQVVSAAMTPDAFAWWVAEGIAGFTTREIDAAIDSLVAQGEVERRMDPVTGEDWFRLSGDDRPLPWEREETTR